MPNNLIEVFLNNLPPTNHKEPKNIKELLKNMKRKNNNLYK